MEYQQACLLLGRTKDALQLGHRQMALTGGTADARSNLAVALLLDGDLDAADAEAAEAAVLAPDDAINESIRRAIADVREGRRPQPRTLRDLGPAAAAPIPTEGLEPEEARRAFEEAFSAYRTLLEADPGRVLSPEERTRFEEMTGPIQRVEIVARDVELIWTGRRLGPSLTERTILSRAEGCDRPRVSPADADRSVPGWVAGRSLLAASSTSQNGLPER